MQDAGSNNDAVAEDQAKAPAPARKKIRSNRKLDASGQPLVFRRLRARWLRWLKPQESRR